MPKITGRMRSVTRLAAVLIVGILAGHMSARVQEEPNGAGKPAGLLVLAGKMPEATIVLLHGGAPILPNWLP